MACCSHLQNHEIKVRWKTLTKRGKGGEMKSKETKEEQKQHINEMSKYDEKK